MKPVRLCTVALAATLAVSLSSAARADEKAQEAKKACGQAYTQAQAFRDAHQLKSARDQLRICSQPTCKEFIVKDCSAWLVDVEGRMPSVIFSVKDGQGQSLIEVAVSMDGNPLVPKLDGIAVDLDPGAHTFTFDTSDGGHAKQTTLVLEGQKAQLVAVTMPAPAASAPAAATPAASTPAATSAGASSASSSATSKPGVETSAPSFWTTQREIGATTAGLGVAGIIVGSVFGLMTISAANQQKTDCVSATSCANHTQALTDHSTASTDGAIATAGYIAGPVLAIGGAVVMLLGGPDASASPKKDATALSILPMLGPNSAGMLLTKGF